MQLFQCLFLFNHLTNFLRFITCWQQVLTLALSCNTFFSCNKALLAFISNLSSSNFFKVTLFRAKIGSFLSYAFSFELTIEFKASANDSDPSSVDFVFSSLVLENPLLHFHFHLRLRPTLRMMKHLQY